MTAHALSRLSILALGLTAAIGSAQTAPLSVTPNPAPAGKAFTLTLQVEPVACNTVFTRESVTVAGTRIDLTYSSETLLYPAVGPIDPVSDCPIFLADTAGTKTSLPIAPNLPMFAMPALKAGTFEVYATYMPACLYQDPRCLIAVQPRSAGKLVVQGAAQTSYILSPVSVQAGQAFDLHLLSYDFNCGTVFSDQRAEVSGNTLVLSFSSKENPAALCPAVVMPYGPTFKVPALKAGSYAVKARRNACLNCDTVVVAEDAGTLQVTSGPAHKGWYLKEDTVPGITGFAMQLLRDDLGSCGTAFTDQRLTVTGKAIAVSFSIAYLDVVCIRDERPYGPTFQMPALKPGAYPVSVADCDTDPSLCRQEPAISNVVDTLVAIGAAAIPISRMRAGSPRLELRGETAYFDLPAGGTGTWVAELAALDGSLLGRTDLRGSAGDRVSIPIGRAPRGAVSLLRLVSPDGKSRISPLVR